MRKHSILLSYQLEIFCFVFNIISVLLAAILRVLELMS